MSTDTGSYPSTDEPTTELDHVTIENEDAPDECAFFPRGASEDELMTCWIIASEGSFVPLNTMR